MFSRFDKIPACDRQTYRRTDTSHHHQNLVSMIPLEMRTWNLVGVVGPQCRSSSTSKPIPNPNPIALLPATPVTARLVVIQLQMAAYFWLSEYRRKTSLLSLYLYLSYCPTRRLHKYLNVNGEQLNVTKSKPDLVSWKAVQLLTLFQVSAAASSSVNTAGRDALVTSLMICCGFIACWSIHKVVYFLKIAGIYDIDFSSSFYHFTVMLVLLNSPINPFIYAAKYREFQTGVRRLGSRGDVG